MNYKIQCMIYKHGPPSTLADEYSLKHKTVSKSNGPFVKQNTIGVSIVNQGKENILIARVLVKMLVVIR